MPLIPVTTKLKPEQIEPLKQAIERRVNKLKKLKCGQIEESLWLMGEIEHLRELLEFNCKKHTTNCGVY